MLEAIGIEFSYSKHLPLLNNIHLTIHPGEIVGLYGYNGSGKTTLSKILAGYLEPKKGKVLVDGVPLSKIKSGSPVQLVWQHPEKAINPKWKMKKILEENPFVDDQILSLLGIKNAWLNRWPSELSGGELQRFCLARAICGKTKYLIADEMTTMLDAISQAQIWSIILQLAKEKNLGVLAISHDIHLLNQISDRKITMEEIEKSSIKA